MDEYDEIVLGGILTQHAQGKLSAKQAKAAIREVGYTADLRNFKHGEQAVLKIGNDTYDFIEYESGGEVRGNMADSVVRNANKEDDTLIFDADTSAGDEYLMENQDPYLGTDFNQEDADDIIRRLTEDPYSMRSLAQDTTGSFTLQDYDPQKVARERLVTFGGSESEGGLADPMYSDIDISDISYKKPGIALNQYGDPNPDSGAIPLKYGGSPGIEGLMMKKTTKMEMPADRNKLVLNRILQQGGKPNSNDPRLMAQLSTILGRKSG
jgi:hypothetical protein